MLVPALSHGYFCSLRVTTIQAEDERTLESSSSAEPQGSHDLPWKDTRKRSIPTDEQRK